MITSEEFDIALKLIVDYELQLDEHSILDVLAKNQKINIQENIKERTFRVLQKYYHLYYATRLQWEDLKAMDRHLLETIDYDKMKLLKGYKRMSLFNFNKLTIPQSNYSSKEF
jgi:hypothetical protein